MRRDPEPLSTPPTPHGTRRVPWIVASLALVTFGCGGGGGAGAVVVPTEATTVSESLALLGVPLDESQRRGPNGETLPDDWKPLGPRPLVRRHDELMVVGRPSTGLYRWSSLDPEDPDRFELLADSSSSPWSSSLVRIARADFDGDGREEFAAAVPDPDIDVITLFVVDDLQQGLLPLAEHVVLGPTAPRAEVAAGDFDGDGAPEIVIAMFEDGNEVEIRFFDYEAFQIAPFGPTIVVPGIQQTSRDAVKLVAGQLDLDAAHELGVSYTQLWDDDGMVLSSVRYRQGRTRYVVLDDANTSFAELASGTIAAEVESVPRTAMAGEIAFGDVDGDGLDEVILGGITEQGQVDAGPETTMGFLLHALDDRLGDLAPIGAAWISFANVGAPTPRLNQWIQACRVEALDLDGDAIQEVLVGNQIRTHVSGGWAERAEIPFEQLIVDGSIDPEADPLHIFEGRIITYDGTNDGVAIARLTSGDRDNVVSYSRALGEEVRVWGLDEGGEMRRLDTRKLGTVHGIFPMNVDGDTLALEYVPGSRELVFSAPVVLAVLAAAPCGPGQDPFDCRTAYGVQDSQSSEEEYSVASTAGITVGVKGGFSLGPFVLGGELKESMSRTIEKSTGLAYELTQRITRETGPVQDSVIFTSIPFDQYTYRVVVCDEPSGLQGREILVSIPRRPVVLMTSAAFYNARRAPGSAPIDGLVLRHGNDPRSYLSQSAAQGVVAVAGGLTSDQIDVGEGTGNVQVQLQVGQAYSHGESITTSWQADVEASAGPGIAGFSYGEERTSSLRVTVGQTLIFRGQVGQISAEFFDDNAFSFGLIAYPHDEQRDGRSFHVVNYWVTPLR